MLGTIALAPPTGLTAVADPAGTITLSWIASPSAAQRAVEYAILRRPAGVGSFVEVMRTGLVGNTDVSVVDAPPAGTYDYVVRTLVSSFTSAETPIVTASTIR